jgi:hypothetical protein
MVAHVHQDALDRYYTLPAVVDICIAALPDLTGYTVVEPSAGGGAFSSRFPGCVALDLSPAAPGIVAADFLTWVPPESVGRIAVVGNPPYGVNGSLVSRFIKRSCSFADLVAFVLPLSYAKLSMHARWPKNFHLIAEVVLPTPNATLNGVATSTRNVWQVWERREEVRERPPRLTAIGWSKCARSEATIAIRTHGVGQGRLSNPATANASSHLFVRFDVAVDLVALEAHLVAWPWPALNMGQPSAGWDDYAPALNAYLYTCGGLRPVVKLGFFNS